MARLSNAEDQIKSAGYTIVDPFFSTAVIGDFVQKLSAIGLSVSGYSLPLLSPYNLSAPPVSLQQEESGMGFRYGSLTLSE